MCGRYANYRSKMDYENALEAAGGLVVDRARGAAELAASYNVAPSQQAWIARRDEAGVWLDAAGWGLVASWSKSPKESLRPINARSESVATSKLYAPLLRRRRCLVPCDGFYEWKKTPDGKQPYLIRMADAEPFFFAGVYDVWQGAEGDTLVSYSIITGPANACVAGIHARMPAIVAPAHYARWLDTAITTSAELADILQPYPAEHMSAFPVSRRVNSPRNNDARLIEPATA